MKEKINLFIGTGLLFAWYQGDIKERKRLKAKHRKKNKVKQLNDLGNNQKHIFWNRD